MKKIEKLKLNQLSKAELEKREMNGIRGGYSCSCSCYYKNNGGSSTVDNKDANYGSTYPTPCSCEGDNAAVIEQNRNSVYNYHNQH